MAKDIKGAFQIFLQVIDNEKYKYNSNSDLIDIFSKDSSVVDELKKNREILLKIDNFELLIENVSLFYINKHRTQNFFAVGKDNDRNEYTVFLIWSSDRTAEEAIMEGIDTFNRCVKKILKKTGVSKGRKINIDVNGGEELIVFPAKNCGQKNYDQQSIENTYESIKWLKISKIEERVNKLDQITIVITALLGLIFVFIAYTTQNWSWLSYFAGIAIPIIYEIIKRNLSSKKQMKFMFNSLVNTEEKNIILLCGDDKDEIKDPELVRGGNNV